jgi:hypothetical protein
MLRKYPLLPSVEHLLQLNGLNISAVERIKPTGPKGRLLKGDVLAYLGTIPSSYPTELSNKIEKLTHLDVSNIKMAPPPPLLPKEVGVEAASPSPTPSNPITTEVTAPISLATVVEAKSRIQRTLGVSLPLEIFIDRATDIANDDLPRSVTTKPSADELFNQILGLDEVSSGIRGNFSPQIVALPTTAAATMTQKNIDIIDFLASKRPVSGSKKGSDTVSGTLDSSVSATTNMFSVSVPRGDEKRARVFLERIKAVLESEPGRLVL